VQCFTTQRLGPCDSLREAAAESLLPAAREMARRAGVTRLANVTHLDRLGLPVWQAIRPMSRALSVHQGKGASDAEAKIGALLEAVESHSAEGFDGHGPVCAFHALPEGGRAPTVSDFAVDRRRPPPPDQTFRWAEAQDLFEGTVLYVPWESVSLDLTRHVPSVFDRASNGVAAGATREEAIAVALHELIERDAVTEWKARGMLGCMEATIRLDTIGFSWFRHWRDRIEAAGAYLRLYHVPSITGTPVVACEISDLGKEGAAYRAMQGRGCHPLPEVSLFKALAEAIQGRATYIAGAREDLPTAHYKARAEVLVAFGLPLPPSMDGIDFNAIAAGPKGLDALAGALVRAGYGRLAYVQLAHFEPIHVVRAFVCGLGSLVRRRRPPMPT
jgi:ribosomal protein S12 methylthiotransferase accessory factor